LGEPGPADPTTLLPRLLLARRLLERGQESEAHPHLVQLVSDGVAEAAANLAVYHVRRGELPDALGWMERACALAPEEPRYAEQAANLRRALEEESPGDGV
jgi:hypothetical protein